MLRRRARAGDRGWGGHGWTAGVMQHLERGGQILSKRPTMTVELCLLHACHSELLFKLRESQRSCLTAKSAANSSLACAPSHHLGLCRAASSMSSWGARTAHASF